MVKRLVLIAALLLAPWTAQAQFITLDEFLGPAGDAYWHLEKELRGAVDEFDDIDRRIDAKWAECSDNAPLPGNQRNVIRWRFLFERNNQGKSLEHAVQVWSCWDPEPEPEPEPLPGPNPPRVGPVSLDGYMFVDSNGPFKGFGATCMWCLWGEKFDRTRLLQSMDYLSIRGVNYLRILTVVDGDYWNGKKIDPSWSDYFAQLDQLFADATARNMYLDVVLFGDTKEYLTQQQQRIDWVNQMAGYLERHRNRILFVEIANESTGIGIDDRDLAELTDTWRRASTIQVAASAPYDDPSRAPLTGIESFFDDYSDVEVDLLTPHLDRDIREERYRPARQPWHPQFFEHVPTHTWVNDEPIGCGSSVESECDPGRIVAAFINTFAAKGAGYTWHTSAGVRGDVNYWDQDNAEEQLLAIRNMMRLLPGNIANGQNCNHHWACHPYEDFDQVWPEFGGSGVVRAFAIESGGQWYVMVIGMRGSYEVAAKRPMGVEVFDAVSGARIDTLELAAGQRHTFQQVGGSRDYVHRITPR